MKLCFHSHDAEINFTTTDVSVGGGLPFIFF